MVSIIVPVYNAEKYLQECVDSLLRQTYKDIEIILVNDGSHDNSGGICEEYAGKDYRVKYLSQENGGVSVARNVALDIAKGEYVCFVDSDDVVDDRFIETLLGMAGTGSFAICGYTRDQTKLGEKGDARRRYDANNYIIQIFSESLIHPNIWMMLFKNNIIQSASLRFTPGCVRNEDTEFYIKYMTYEKDILVSDYKGYFYRDNPNSAVHKFNEKSLTFIEADQRISDYLIKKGIVAEKNLIVPASVQYFVYQTACQKNREIYEIVHSLYPVKEMMKGMTRHPRLSRRGVAWVYLALGIKMFYKVMSII